MKRKITLFLSVILICLTFSSCTQKAEPCGWLDDVEALSIKLNKMNQSEVHNFLGEPAGKLLDTNCEIYLDNNGIGIFVHYNDKEEMVDDVELYEKDKMIIESVSSEKKQKAEYKIPARTRYEIMTKLIGRDKDYMLKRYGEPNKVIEKKNAYRYDELLGYRVTAFFNEEMIVEKVLIEEI